MYVKNKRRAGGAGENRPIKQVFCLTLLVIGVWVGVTKPHNTKLTKAPS